MKQNLEFIALLLSITANIVGFLVWYNSAQRKKYAAESAFERIEDNNREIRRLLESSKQRQAEVAQQIQTKIDVALNSFVRESQMAQNEIVGEIKQMQTILQVLAANLTGGSISDLLVKRYKREE